VVGKAGVGWLPDVWGEGRACAGIRDRLGANSANGDTPVPPLAELAPKLAPLAELPLLCHRWLNWLQTWGQFSQRWHRYATVG